MADGGGEKPPGWRGLCCLAYVLAGEGLPLMPLPRAILRVFLKGLAGEMDAFGILGACCLFYSDIKQCRAVWGGRKRQGERRAVSEWRTSDGDVRSTRVGASFLKDSKPSL